MSLLSITTPGPSITAVGLAGLLVAEYAGSKAGRWVFKPLASAGFLVTAYTSPSINTAFGKTIFGSLLLSFAGDVFLIPGTPAMFQAGLFSFLLGHVGFGYAFAQRGLDRNLTLGATAGGALAAGTVLQWLAPHLPANDRIPVALYTAIISGMTTCAIGSAWNTPAPWIQIAGAIIFQLSDLCVARGQFVTQSIANPLVGLPLYYLAQQLIASLLWY